MTLVAQPPQYLLNTRIRAAAPAPESGSQTSGSTRSPKEISFNVSQPAADWLRQSIQRIQDLTALAPGWDGYGAKPIDAGVAVDAVSFLIDHAYPTVSEPAVVPLADGGIQLEWHVGGIDLEIAFSDEDGGVFLEDQATGATEEHASNEAGRVFVRSIGRLAGRG
jgi:hypothetical protein